MNIIIPYVYNHHNNQLNINCLRDNSYRQSVTLLLLLIYFPSIVPIDNANSWYSLTTKLLLVEQCLKVRTTNHFSAACVEQLKCNVTQDATVLSRKLFPCHTRKQRESLCLPISVYQIAQSGNTSEILSSDIVYEGQQ